MTLSQRIADDEIEANAAAVAAEIIAHPSSLLLARSAISALASIAERDPPAISAPEHRVLRRALDVVDAVEIAMGLEMRP